MSAPTNNIRFELFSNERSVEAIPEIKGFQSGKEDVIELDDKRKSFKTIKAGEIEIAKNGVDYLDAIRAVYGIRPNVRLLEHRKDPTRIDERLKNVSDVGIDLSTLDFNRENKTVKFDTIEGGMIQTIESRISDDYDIYTTETLDEQVLTPLQTVDVRLEPRQIFRRSRLVVENGTEVIATVSGGDRLNARAIPLKVDYNNDKNDVQEVLGDQLNAASNNYSNINDADKAFNLFYLNANTDTELTLNGKVRTVITNAQPGTFTLDLVTYNNGGSLEYKEKAQLDSCNPGQLGAVCEFTFTDYKVPILKGESLALATLSDTLDGIRYEIFETSLIITEDDTFPQTYTKAYKPYDWFNRLVYIITGKENAFKSSLFESGGKYENILITHGTQLRNMPLILNEGEDDERKLQIVTQLEDSINAFKILEPLRYGVEKEGDLEYFYIEPEKDLHQNFTSIRLGKTIDGSFSLITVQKEGGRVLGDNYFSSITLGSNTTGSEYGEVNNLYSVCGNASWSTINDARESKYEITTDWRTGAEDLELTRQLQYEDNPDIDSERDDELFLIDCKQVGNEYHLKKWQDYFSVIPTNVYSPDTNYNWRFIPSFLLDGHGWYINAGLWEYKAESLKFISSNCNSSLITNPIGKSQRAEDGKVRHLDLEPPTFIPYEYSFNLPINDEIDAMLTGSTGGIDNKFGMVEFKGVDGGIYKGRLIKVNKNNEVSWELIQARENG